jgi:hypothetical protein
MINRKKLSILFIILFSLLIGGCDIFTGSKVDLYQAISDEVDWAHAEKLNVRIDFPAAWGTSAPPQGDITPAKDLRAGYEFSVDFTPGGMYALISWQAFLTSDLADNVSGQQGQIGNWLEDPSLIAEKGIESLGRDDVTLPAITEENARGGTYKFTIYTTEPVTIVPWCDPQLRITRTEPRDFKRSGKPVSRASDIILYFNGALNEKTVRFANSKDENGIWITAVSDSYDTNNFIEKWFTTLEYASVGGFFTVTMNSGAKLPPEDCLMTLTVKGIESAQGDPMEAEGYSFSWKTSSKAEVNLISYNALYNDDEKSIDVSCEQEGADWVKMFYRLNGEARTEFYGTIENVPVLNDTGVRNGISVSNIVEYEIFIELYADGVMEERASFKIWNFPGMSVAHNDPVKEIKTAAELAAMKDNLGGQFVLADNIEINGEWTPVGTSYAAFSGKFYGNGKKITFNDGSSMVGDAYRGLFGYAQDAVIRDFTFVYYGSAVSGDWSEYIGGVAGYLKDTTVCNVITSGGTLGITMNSGYIVRFGGITGYIEGSGKIENCRAGLSTEYTSNGNSSDVRIGAIAGETGEGAVQNTMPFDNGYNMFYNGIDKFDKLDRLLIDGVTVAANVTADKGSDIGYICIGGAVGKSGQNTMNDIKFTVGKVLFSGNYDSDKYCGGIVGNFKQTNLTGSSFSGAIETGTVDGEIYLGGLVGYIYIPDAAGKFFIHDCLMVQTDIKLSGGKIKNVGGVLGGMRISSSMDITTTITDSYFDGGSIVVEGNARSVFIGGFFGISYGGGYNIENCGVLSGTINVDHKTEYSFNVGGFFSENAPEDKRFSNISKCFSMMDIIVKGSFVSYGNINVGGFASYIQSDDIIDSCYTAGNITVTIDGNGDTCIGGLVGLSLGTITNCYALGNIVVDKSGGSGSNICAGGLIGVNQNGSISNCFNTGQVIAQSATTSQINTGGIVGLYYGRFYLPGNIPIITGKIENTAALGVSITAKSSNKSIGRIYGSIDVSDAKGSNNYALNTMVIAEGAYDSITPAIRPAVSNANDSNGQDTASSTFLNQAFWNKTLDFSNAYWNFSRVAIEGYPRLAWEFQK